MPTKPKLACTVPGCSNLVTTSGRCKTHGRTNTARRRQASPWWNYGATWRKAREVKLATQPNCECTGCTAPHCCHGTKPATEVHHRTALQDGGTHNQTNLMSICRACHQRLTINESRQRTGARP